MGNRGVSPRVPVHYVHLTAKVVLLGGIADSEGLVPLRGLPFARLEAAADPVVLNLGRAIRRLYGLAVAQARAKAI